MARDTYEQEAERSIRETFPQIDAWHSAKRFEAIPGSELHADDCDWPMPLTETVRLKLDLAAEQLHQVKVMIEAGELSLSSQRVLVRTALISSSIATWTLAPHNAVTRRGRRRLLIEQTTFRHQQALAEQAALEKLAGQPVQPTLQAVLNHTTQRLAEIRQLRASDQQTETWNDTEVIRKAALWAFRNQADPGALAKEAVLEFRITSGAAHGLAWGLFNSSGIRASSPVDSRGRALMEVKPTYAALANGYRAAYWISTAAWQLLQQRGR